MTHDPMCPVATWTFGRDDSAPCGLCGVPEALIPMVRADEREKAAERVAACDVMTTDSYAKVILRDDAFAAARGSDA
jgi:hypothetical protein